MAGQWPKGRRSRQNSAFGGAVEVASGLGSRVEEPCSTSTAPKLLLRVSSLRIQVTLVGTLSNSTSCISSTYLSPLLIHRIYCSALQLTAQYCNSFPKTYYLSIRTQHFTSLQLLLTPPWASLLQLAHEQSQNDLWTHKTRMPVNYLGAVRKLQNNILTICSHLIYLKWEFFFSENGNYFYYVKLKAENIISIPLPQLTIDIMICLLPYA